MAQPTLINFHSIECSQESHYFQFVVKLYRCVRSCNILNDLPNKVFVPNKTEDLNISTFNMTAVINGSKILRNQISCKCKYKFDGIKRNSDQWWNNNKCWCGCKNVMYAKKFTFGILIYVAVKMKNI